MNFGIGGDPDLNLVDFSDKTALSGEYVPAGARKGISWSGHAANVFAPSGDFASIQWYVRPARE